MKEERDEIVIPPWTSEIPTEPGYYWFWYNYLVEHCTNPEFREIKKDREGKLYMANQYMNHDWGPDPKYLALSHSGYWQKAEVPDAPIILTD